MGLRSESSGMLELEGVLAFKLDPGGCSFSWLAVEPVLIVMKRGYPTLESLGQNLQSKPHKTKPRNPKPLNSEPLEPRSRKPSIYPEYPLFGTIYPFFEGTGRVLAGVISTRSPTTQNPKTRTLDP